MTKNQQEIEMNPYYIKEGMKIGFIYRLYNIAYDMHHMIWWSISDYLQKTGVLSSFTVGHRR